MKTKNRRAGEKDLRVTAPLISWKVAIASFGSIYLLILAQAFILSAFWDKIPAMIGTLSLYLIATCMLTTLIVGLIWRKVIGKPLRKVADGARRVASGDFSVQLESSRKSGKKNEIDVLIDDFNKMTRELDKSEMLKSDFISNVSHEIKTPLSVIHSYTKAIKDGRVPDSNREEYLDAILTASENMNSMITNILKLSKLENQQIFQEPHIYELGEQLRSCALLYMDKWQAKNIEFQIDVVDTAVCCDESLLELVWNNLLSNAVKFTDDCGYISLTSRLEGDYVYVDITDTGCGMDDETKSRLFEKFYQGDTSHSTEGNGLGMALVKKILDITGGEIYISTHPGYGSTFTVRLMNAD